VLNSRYLNLSCKYDIAIEFVKYRINSIVISLYVFLDAEKLAGKPIKLVRMRVAVKAVKILE
jgi:hypothetical protein